MNFSQALRVTANQVVWSHHGQYCAIAVTARLEIRDGCTLQLHSSFNCSEYIQFVKWSPDSTLVCTANFKRGIIEIWQLLDPKWRCKIDEGAAGLLKFIWAPDSRHILTTADYHIRMTVWSLVNKTVLYIKHPKDIVEPLQFTHDGDYLAVAEREECKDFFSIIETKAWTPIRTFGVSTRDLAGFAWAPDDSVIAAWDSPVEYKVLIYTVCGQCLTSYSAYEWALGVRTVSWSPSCQFVAIGSYDQKIRLMNHITWKIIAEFHHVTFIENTYCTIYKEENKPLTGYSATLAAIQGLPLYIETNYEEVKSRPVNLTVISSNNNNKLDCAKLGVSEAMFSKDGRFLASKVENMPNTVWIWSIVKLCLESLLVHKLPIKDLSWSTKQTCLAMCTGLNFVYLWTPMGCLTVAVPNLSAIQITSLRWHPSGRRVALLGKDNFSVCFLESKNGKTDASEALSNNGDANAVLNNTGE